MTDTPATAPPNPPSEPKPGYKSTEFGVLASLVVGFTAPVVVTMKSWIDSGQGWVVGIIASSLAAASAWYIQKRSELKAKHGIELPDFHGGQQ